MDFLKPVILFLILVALLVAVSFVPANVSPNSGPLSKINPASQMPTLSIFEAPILSKINNRSVLFYEIYVSNYSLAPSKLEVLDENNKIIYSIGGADINATLLPVQSWDGRTPIRMWVELGSKTPLNISHKLYFGNQVIQGAQSEVIYKPLLVIAPPFHTNITWLAMNAPSNFEPHRNAIFELNGKDYVPQRYAIDWVIADEAGNWGIGNGSLNSDFYCYGQEILAVANGTVVNMQDGIRDNMPGQRPVANVVILGGNYVVLDLHNGYYAFYGHMIPGSLRVKNGDNVTAGQVIGLLGNSGNSNAAHLHFHVCDSMDYLFCHGQPYAFSTYTAESTDDNGKWKNPTSMKTYSNSIPENYDAVSWK